MAQDDPVGWFVTWTVYGSHLQGAAQGWRKYGKGNQIPQPLLEEWHRTRLSHQVLSLNIEQRRVVEVEIEHHCKHRGWHLWGSSARSNHVHVVVTAVGCRGSVLRDQLKANATRVLRQSWQVFVDRPIWTRGGDTRPLYDEDALHKAIEYVRDAQDRKGRGLA